MCLSNTPVHFYAKDTYTTTELFLAEFDILHKVLPVFLPSNPNFDIHMGSVYNTR